MEYARLVVFFFSFALVQILKL